MLSAGRGHHDDLRVGFYVNVVLLLFAVFIAKVALVCDSLASRFSSGKKGGVRTVEI